MKIHPEISDFHLVEAARRESFFKNSFKASHFLWVTEKRIGTIKNPTHNKYGTKV